MCVYVRALACPRQGEQNVGPLVPDFYACAMPGLVTDWRNGFNNPNMWFGIVMLAPWITGSNVALAVEREAQMAVLNVPNTAIAAAFDLGDPTVRYLSPFPPPP